VVTLENEIRQRLLRSQSFISAYRTSAYVGEHKGMAARHFAKVGVEGSNPFARSSFQK
jgi:hypothetical protein